MATSKQRGDHGYIVVRQERYVAAYRSGNADDMMEFMDQDDFVSSNFGQWLRLRILSLMPILLALDLWTRSWMLSFQVANEKEWNMQKSKTSFKHTQQLSRSDNQNHLTARPQAFRGMGMGDQM